MLNQLLETIIQILTGWLNKFDSHAQHVEDKLDSLDQTASDIETNTEPISDIADNTGAVVTPIQNIKSNTDSIKQSSQTSANNTTAILNNISTLSTNTGRSAAFAKDCANNTLDIKAKLTTIASDTTQIRTDSDSMVLEQSKIYNAVKWLLADKTTTEGISGTGILSFETDMTEGLNNCILTFNSVSGFSSANVFRTGKNLIPSLSSPITSRNVTFNPQSDGSIKISGTAIGGTATCDVARSNNLVLPIGSYYVNASTTDYTITVYKEVGGTATVLKMGGGYFTIAEPTKVFIRIGVLSDITVDTTISLQLELGSTATEYATYNGTSVVIPFGNTYYAGRLDVINGIGFVADTPNTIPSIPITFTPGVINTLKGLNNIYADIESNLSITYTETVKFYLDKQNNS